VEVNLRLASEDVMIKLLLSGVCGVV